ncbi:MAG: DUF3311 domain-containing protein [Gammaproteobacteria bacterium]
MLQHKRNFWAVLLVVPMLASLWIPLFNHLHPAFFGIPFFYWYLLIWVPLSGAFNALVVYLIRPRRSPLP